MYELKNIGKLLTSRSVGTGPSSYEKRIYRAAVSKRCRRAPVALVTSVRPSVLPSFCMYQCSSHWTDFLDTFYWWLP